MNLTYPDTIAAQKALGALNTASLIARNTFKEFTTRTAVTNGGNSPKKAQLRSLPRTQQKRARRVRVANASVLQTRRTGRQLTPAAARVAEWNILSSQHDTPARRMLGLWQARSVQRMIAAERTFSAWSPQLSVRARRAHSPRVKGVPRARR